jgi:hypothetical protein
MQCRNGKSDESYDNLKKALECAKLIFGENSVDYADQALTIGKYIAATGRADEVEPMRPSCALF